MVSPRNTIDSYVGAVERFARFFGRSPAELDREHIRTFQVHLVCDRHISTATLNVYTSALRFLYNVTLERDWDVRAIPGARTPKRLPGRPGRFGVRRGLQGWSGLHNVHTKTRIHVTDTRTAPLILPTLGGDVLDAQVPVVARHVELARLPGDRPPAGTRWYRCSTLPAAKVYPVRDCPQLGRWPGGPGNGLAETPDCCRSPAARARYCPVTVAPQRPPLRMQSLTRPFTPKLLRPRSSPDVSTPWFPNKRVFQVTPVPTNSS